MADIDGVMEKVRQRQKLRKSKKNDRDRAR